MTDLLKTYRNYLFSLQTRAEYGDKYGDTDELIKIYEKKLAKVLGKEKYEERRIIGTREENRN